DVFVVLKRCYLQTTQCSAIFLGNNEVVRNVNKTTCQVSCIGCFQRRIGKTFTSTVSRDEVLQYVETFLEIGKNRVFDDRPNRTGKVLLWLRHQTTHTTQLTNLFSRTPCT